MSDTDRVVVVGLGPVGAVTALLLGKAGIPTLVLERAAGIFPHGRAVALDEEALRVLQAAGLRKTDLPEMLAQVPVTFRGRHGQPLLQPPAPKSLAGHPSLVFFHQPDLEQRLRSALQTQSCVQVLLEHEVERCEQGVHGVAITARDLRSGEGKHFEAGWVIACDGASSRIRREAGIRLRGVTSGRRWLVVDTRLPTRPARPSFEFLCDPRRPTVSASLPGRRHRWEFMLLPGEDGGEMEEPETIRALVGEHAAFEDHELLHGNVYTFHARVADRWRKGRLLLAGDAAHLSPPFAGQGLSTGLRDAHNLAWKLSAVIEQRAAPALLDSYEIERRPHAVRLISLALVLGALIQVKNRAVAVVRDLALGAVLDVPPLRRHFDRGGWKPSSRYRRGLVSHRRRRRRIEGAQLPQPHVFTVDGSEWPLDNLLGGHFALIGWEVDPAASLPSDCRPILATLPATLVHAAPSIASLRDSTTGVAVVDTTGSLERWFDRAGARFALVRPDRHVYAAFGTSEARAVLRELARALDTSPPRGSSRDGNEGLRQSSGSKRRRLPRFGDR